MNEHYSCCPTRVLRSVPPFNLEESPVSSGTTVQYKVRSSDNLVVLKYTSSVVGTKPG